MEALAEYYSAISIHALREESDRITSRSCGSRSRFLSTPSARRATGLRPLLSLHT